MWKGICGAQYNGIVLFDPDALKKYYGRIQAGANLFKRFTTTTDGDDMLALGIVVPVLAIDDDGYTIIVRETSEPSPVEPHVIATNETYPFKGHARGSVG